MKTIGIASMMIACVTFTAGCHAFRHSVETRDPARAPALTANYDQKDLLEWGEAAAQKILADPFLVTLEQRPTLVDLGIQNRTKTHIDTKALMDTITTKLLDSRRVDLVNSARRDDLLNEQGYQLANCTPETQAKIGKQLGANYMLTGSLTELGAKSGREVRLSRKRDVFYQLTVEITDVTTGKIALRKQQERLRRESRPIIGW